MLRDVIERAVEDAVEIAYAPLIIKEEDVADYELENEISAALAHVNHVRKQAKKTQAEIDKLKKETRALIKDMQAA